MAPASPKHAVPASRTKSNQAPSSCANLAPRPGYSALGSERGALMPPLADALARHVGMGRVSGAQGGAGRLAG